MAQKLSVFDYNFNNPELEEEFNNFFFKNGLLPLFTDEHRSTPIKVGYSEAVGVIKGAYKEDLKTLANKLMTAVDNKSYQEMMLKIIYNSGTVNNLMRRVRKLNDYIKNDILDKHQFNKWNITWYDKTIF